MVIFIYLCILLLNIVAIFMTYKFLGEDFEKKEKSIFLVVGIAIMYMIVSLVYWLSTRGIDLGINNEMGKNFIIFTFVPINSMLVLPFLASSYKYFKQGRLKKQNFKNRIILLCAILIIVLILEFFYFKDIQNSILNMLAAKK